MNAPKLRVIHGKKQQFHWSSIVETDDGFEGLYVVYEVKRRVAKRILWQSGEWCKQCDKVYCISRHGLYGHYPPPDVCPICWGNRPFPYAWVEFEWNGKTELGHIDETGQWWVMLGNDYPTDPPEIWKPAARIRRNDLQIFTESDCQKRYVRNLLRHPYWAHHGRLQVVK